MTVFIIISSFIIIILLIILSNKNKKEREKIVKIEDKVEELINSFMIMEKKYSDLDTKIIGLKNENNNAIKNIYTRLPLFELSQKDSKLSINKTAQNKISSKYINMFFLQTPDERGFFWDSLKSENYNNYKSCYVMRILKDSPNLAEFSIVNVPQKWQIFISSFQLYLAPVCEIINNNYKGKDIVVHSLGTLEFNNSKWNIKTKLKISIL